MPSKPKVFLPPRRSSPFEDARFHDRARGTARQRGYTAEWDKASAWFKREHPLCLGCMATGRVAATTTVDHVLPHKGDRQRFWDRSRWQPACDWHHDTVKQQLEVMFARGEIGEADLWLDSAVAVALAQSLRPNG